MALMVVLSCLLYTLLRSYWSGDNTGPGSSLTGVKLKTMVPSVPEAGVRSNVATGSAVKLVLRLS